MPRRIHHTTLKTLLSRRPEVNGVCKRCGRGPEMPYEFPRSARNFQSNSTPGPMDKFGDSLVKICDVAFPVAYAITIGAYIFSRLRDPERKEYLRRSKDVK